MILLSLALESKEQMKKDRANRFIGDGTYLFEFDKTLKAKDKVVKKPKTKSKKK